jgi:deoxycytidine triphosphate deaminase
VERIYLTTPFVVVAVQIFSGIFLEVMKENIKIPVKTMGLLAGISTLYLAGAMTKSFPLHVRSKYVN